VSDPGRLSFAFASELLLLISVSVLMTPYTQLVSDTPTHAYAIPQLRLPPDALAACSEITDVAALTGR
jgi:hypothetical protein